MVCGGWRTRAAVWLGAFISPLAVSICAASTAVAADSVYWSLGNFGGSIRDGNLNGTGSAATLFSGESSPRGLAIDPAAGKIYWADPSSGTIRVANLDGSGSPLDLFTGESNPVGVAIDPAAGKVYWADNPAGTIRVGNLNGIGSPANLFAGEDIPDGVAIDPAAGKVYWDDFGSGAIRVGNLNGTGSPSSLFTGENSPASVAIDHAAAKIYWTSYHGGTIRVGNLNGTDPQNLFAGEGDFGPTYLALLRSPAGTGRPRVSGRSTPGSKLTCSHATWAPDVPGSMLYRAPHSVSYNWTRDGRGIGGASTTSIRAKAAGDYACQATAANQAGSVSQTSPAHAILPHTEITQTAIRAAKRTAKFTFKATAGARGFQCALTKRTKHTRTRTFARCTSPKTYKNLKPGHYTFEVRALIAGATGKPARKSFTIAADPRLLRPVLVHVLRRVQRLASERLGKAVHNGCLTPPCSIIVTGVLSRMIDRSWAVSPSTIRAVPPLDAVLQRSFALGDQRRGTPRGGRDETGSAAARCWCASPTAQPSLPWPEPPPRPSPQRHREAAHDG